MLYFLFQPPLWVLPSLQTRPPQIVYASWSNIPQMNPFWSGFQILFHLHLWQGHPWPPHSLACQSVLSLVLLVSSSSDYVDLVNNILHFQDNSIQPVFLPLFWLLFCLFCCFLFTSSNPKCLSTQGLNLSSIHTPASWLPVSSEGRKWTSPLNFRCDCWAEPWHLHLGVQQASRILHVLCSLLFLSKFVSLLHSNLKK